MVEPLGDPPSLASNRATALELLRRLQREYDLDFERLSAVGDLFLPSEPHGLFALWVAAGLSAAERPQFKVYLNPAARGAGHTTSSVEECLTRLGFARGWDAIARTLARRGPMADQLVYVSLDLTPGAEARVKIYARHEGATIEDLERAAAGATATRPAETRRFVETMVPSLRRFEGRAPFTCWSFVTGSDYPAAATTHLPVNGYAPNDATIRDRFCELLGRFEMDASLYQRALSAFAERPLEDGAGLHAYVSFRREPGGPRTTVYLPLEIFARGVVAGPTAKPDPIDARALVRHYEELEPITNHPTLRRMAREPVNVAHLWTVLANFQISVSKNFARHLARITARVDDDRVRSILAHQLDDELGNGNPERAHVRLFQRMMERLAPFRPITSDDAMWQPGRNFDANLNDCYEAEDVREAVGAVMVGEVFGKQIDLFLGEQLRRQSFVDVDSLEWLVLHERLEVEHAEDSDDLARLITSDDLPATWQGAQRAGAAGRTFLDDLYTACYGRHA
jgi:pyrroloquinoline quinone (PQQ) biosynthesis protein C